MNEDAITKTQYKSWAGTCLELNSFLGNLLQCVLLPEAAIYLFSMNMPGMKREKRRQSQEIQLSTHREAKVVDQHLADLAVLLELVLRVQVVVPVRADTVDLVAENFFFLESRQSDLNFFFGALNFFLEPKQSALNSFLELGQSFIKWWKEKLLSAEDWKCTAINLNVHLVATQILSTCNIAQILSRGNTIAKRQHFFAWRISFWHCCRWSLRLPTGIQCQDCDGVIKFLNGPQQGETFIMNLQNFFQPWLNLGYAVVSHSTPQPSHVPRPTPTRPPTQPVNLSTPTTTQPNPPWLNLCLPSEDLHWSVSHLWWDSVNNLLNVFSIFSLSRKN